MNDWDVGAVRALEYEQGEYKCNLRPLNPSDARCGYPSLTYEQCLEVSAACDRFFKSRKMPQGHQFFRDQANQIFVKLP